MTDYGKIPARRLAKMIALFEQNGSRKGGTLFTSVDTALKVLRERGRTADADEVERQAKPDDVVCIKGGKMFLVPIDECP